MKNRYNVTNFYTTTLSVPLILSPSGTGSTTIPVSSLPTISDNKFFHIIIKPTDATNRLVMRAYVSGGAMKVDNFDIGASRSFPQDTQVAIFDVAEMFNIIFKQIDDRGYVEQKYTNTVRVYGGDYSLYGVDYNLATTDLTLTDGTREIVFDYADKTVKNIATAGLATLKGVRLANVVAVGGTITTITDKRLDCLPERLDSSYFIATLGVLTIKDGSIGTNKLDPSIGAATAQAHSHANKPVLDNFGDSGGTPTYLGTPIGTGEANTASNVGSGKGVYKQKLGVNLQFKTLKAVGNVQMTETADEIEISDGITVDMATEVFTGTGALNSWVLTDTPVGLVIMADDLGQSMYEGVDYTRSGKNITFLSTPPLGKIIYVQYMKANGLAPAGTGEANTGNNVGLVGVGVYDTKIGVALQFRKIKAGTNVSVTQTVDNEIEISSTGGSGGSATIDRGVPAGAIDGVNAVFTLPLAPVANGLNLFLNGIYQSPTVDYTLVGTTITFVVAPSLGDSVSYESTTATPHSISTSYTGAVNSLNKNYVLTNTPVTNSLNIWLDGLYMTAGIDYTLVGTTVTFVNAPDTGDILVMKYSF